MNTKPQPTIPAYVSIDDDYSAWVSAHDKLTDEDRSAIKADLIHLPVLPIITLLLPVGLNHSDLLLNTLRSLSEQLYPHWEVCLAGVIPELAALNEIAVLDTRVRIGDHMHSNEPGSAAAAAIARAEGNFVAPLSEGDLLAPQALYEVAHELARFPQTDLLYTDEDRIDFDGRRSAPRFKTGWDPDLLLSQNYIGGLAVFSRAAVLACGGPRGGYGKAWNYDLALRATASLQPDRIRHLPAMLYHRLAADPLSPGESDALAECLSARRAAQEFLGSSAWVSPAPLAPDRNRVTWPLPNPAPMVSVIMPTRDHAPMLARAAWGVLLRTDYPNLELLIVDNDSREPETETVLRDLAAQTRVRVLRHPGTFNYSAINNAAVGEARGEVLLLLNNDIDIIHRDWLREMVSHAVRPDVGAVGAKLLYEDGRIQHGGIIFGPGLNAAHMLRLTDRFDAGYNGQAAVTRSFMAVTGACLAVRRVVWDEAGGLNEIGFAIAYNDVDFCLRLGERGYRVVWTPFAELFHLESASRGSADTHEKKARQEAEVDLLWRLWRYVFAADPFLNSSLACSWQEPLHLCPPRRGKPWYVKREFAEVTL